MGASNDSITWNDFGLDIALQQAWPLFQQCKGVWQLLLLLVICLHGKVPMSTHQGCCNEIIEVM